MENQRVPLLSWAYFCHGKTMEELRHTLFYTTLELESTRLAAQEELRKRDDQLIQLKELLNRAMREREEAQEKYQKLLLDKLLLQQQQQQNLTPTAATTPPPLSGVSSVEDDARRGIDSANNGFSSSDCEESIVSSPAAGALPRLPELDAILPEKPVLPEKGKLLQAVMKAGPLLQTLLLAGPLPQWRHPPPPLESFEIPPVTILSPPPPPLLLPDSIVANCGRLCRKKGISEGTDSPTETKFQRVALN
ncbi:uncharacterized protein LOC116198582 [Punica granatum]|uniref:Uncharacterized protein n=2 Tax=Punica granatum TaxID=22663 RepID=A0A218WM76_PUNGR|nr:uncharacterized protein LOC116198582 [Punica granatum]OWM73746.1 hypothetical protein CDL15_Pgr026850 [Punica granatum]PKI64585.1 hypothetical protein CRG98_015017 [Punica granatum]